MLGARLVSGQFKKFLRRLHIYSSEADRPVYKAEFSRELGALREDLGRLLSESSEARNQAESLAREDLRQLLRESSEIREKVDDLDRRIAEYWNGAKARLETLEFLTEHAAVASITCQNAAFPSPAVSVVMPTWNREGVLGAAIRSVQAQTFPDWELLVVDDGSTDATRHVVGTFAADQRIRYVAQEHSGKCAARNHALRIARGALIAYLDSDNLWYPDFLSAAVAAFSLKPDIDCAYGAMVRDGTPRVLSEVFDRERLLTSNFIDMSAFVHRRTLVERFGGFDEGLERLEDWDIVLRYTAHAPAYRLPAFAVRYRVMDNIRTTASHPPQPARAVIRGKWNAG
jgi:hypothetical protein